MSEVNHARQQIVMLNHQVRGERNEKERALSDLATMARRLDIDPQSLVTFPHDVRENVKHLMKQTLSGPELKYLRSIIEPFHPESQGARVPSNTPKETISYSHFSTLPCTEDSVFVCNYEMQVSSPML